MIKLLPKVLIVLLITNTIFPLYGGDIEEGGIAHQMETNNAPHPEMTTSRWSCWIPFCNKDYKKVTQNDPDETAHLSFLERLVSSNFYPLGGCFLGGILPFAVGPFSKPAILATKFKVQEAKEKGSGALKSLLKDTVIYSVMMGTGNVIFYIVNPLSLTISLRLTLIAMGHFYLDSGLAEKQLKAEQKRALNLKSGRKEKSTIEES